jgi:hypothetical protein
MSEKQRRRIVQTGRELQNLERRIGRFEKQGHKAPTVLFERKKEIEQRLIKYTSNYS